MKSNLLVLFAIALVCLLCTPPISSAIRSGANGGGGGNKEENCTELARDDETLLVFSTLGGGLTAVDPITSEIRWSIEDEPAISVPTEEFANPQYLPDPRDGSLYELGNRGGLKKLPYTIPQLVASAPCRSSDGILYSGKKSDTWYLIDPKTGKREKVLDFGAAAGDAAAAAAAAGAENEKIGWATSRALYLGRTQYTVMMYDSVTRSQNRKPWNVTFFDYSAHTMAPEVSKEYEWLHLTASASGMTVTLDRQKGTFMWLKQLESPVVATYLMGPDGLLSVPFTTVSDDTLSNIVEFARDGQKNDIKLFQTLYVGEHPNGLYAIPSLADRNIAQISAEAPINLIDGPNHRPNVDFNSGYLSTLLEKSTDDDDADNIILIGHYQMPSLKSDMKLQFQPTMPKLSDGLHDLATVGTANGFKVININKDRGDQVVILPQNSDDQQAPRKMALPANRSATAAFRLNSLYSKSKRWLNDQESKILKLLLIILMGMIVAMFWYMRHTVRELRQSQTGSQQMGGGQPAIGRAPIGSSYQELIDLGDGEVRVGKIVFNSGQVLGKGCEGTFVFKGAFEKRQVAVKRLLPECFTLADREVALLRESDAHENVVRYFCTEQDRQFRYIAVELCQATLQDYIEGVGVDSELQRNIGALDVLRQATNGLMHLHSLSIVHRDIKPQNVLLSLPGVNGQVRAMISDFGLCKKLNMGRTSFSRRSGVTGTEGWIAPEMLKGQRTTTSVDIFSLGCVYYYVLSNGKHPFGEAVKRQANILAFEYDLSIFNTGAADIPSSKILAEQLVAAMIAKDPQRRPPTRALLNHPFFWSEERVLTFLQDVSDRVEKLDYAVNPLRTLEKNGRMVVRDDWSAHLHESIRADLRKYRGYYGNSVRDLMRALRNKKHHYHELSADMQSILGAVPRDFTRYWVQRFPHLVSHAFHALETCAKESTMREYYTEGYTFPRCEYFAQQYEEFVPVESAPKLPKEMPARKFSKDLRQRCLTPVVAAAAAATAAAGTVSSGGTALDGSGGELLADGVSPRTTTRRGVYNFQRIDGATTGVVEATNWRKRKESPVTPAWTMSPGTQ